MQMIKSLLLLFSLEWPPFLLVFASRARMARIIHTEDRWIKKNNTKQSERNDFQSAEILSHSKWTIESAFEHEVWPHWHQPNHYCVDFEHNIYYALSAMCDHQCWMMENRQCLSVAFFLFYIPIGLLRWHRCAPLKFIVNSPHFFLRHHLSKYVAFHSKVVKNKNQRERMEKMLWRIEWMQSFQKMEEKIMRMISMETFSVLLDAAYTLDAYSAHVQWNIQHTDI